MGSILAIGESLPPCDYSAAQVGWNWWLPGLVCQNCWLLNERNEPLVKSLYYRVPSDGVCNFFIEFLWSVLVPQEVLCMMPHTLASVDQRPVCHPRMLSGSPVTTAWHVLRLQME
jgi:hypothetical protein